MSDINRKIAEAADFVDLNDCYIHVETQKDGRYITVISGGNLAVLGGFVQAIKFYADRTGKKPEEVLKAIEEVYKIQKPVLEKQKRAPRKNALKFADSKKKKK